MFETRVVRPIEFNYSARLGSKKGIFSIFFNIKVCCVLLIESPHVNTQYSIFNIKKENHLNYPKFAAMRFFQGPQE